MIYPNDVNGDVLRRIAAQGKDLTKPRNIDFTVISRREGRQNNLQNTFVN
jgi:hypothetical protein